MTTETTKFPQPWELTQQPGCLPPGYDANSMLTLDQWAVWTRKTRRTAERYLSDMKRKGLVIGNRKGQKPLIHVRTFLANQGPQFRKALE